MIVGIDLGTTHSLIACWRDGKASLVPNALGETLTPSCVSIDGDGSILVGKAARERLQTHPESTAALFKRYMGSDKRLQLGSRSYRPEELSSLVLRALKEDAEALYGEAVEEAVITVPAYFSEAQRKATKTAGQLAGLRVERLLNEPSAAALAYGMHQFEGEAQFLVFDLGGGTFDVSILEMFEGVMEVRASAGDNMLGGEDFTELLRQWFFEESGIAGEAHQDSLFMQRLNARAEQAKRELSQQGGAAIEIAWRGRDYRLALAADAFEQRCRPLLARLWQPVERALRDARIRAPELDNIVLAGGATRMPMVHQLVTRMFGRFPAIGLNPDEVVAIGAAVQAGLKARDAALKEVAMTDVCPYSLGTGTGRFMEDGSYVGGLYSPIIQRNTPVPVSRVQRYFPIREGQRVIDIEVYQGESRLVQDNIRLGQLKVFIPSGPVQQGAVDVRFTYDVNGLLEVEVTVVTTGETTRLVIENSASDMTPAEIEERLATLAALKIHPRDNLENRTLLARAERLYEQLLGNVRDMLGNAILQFESVLKAQEPHGIRRAFRQLNELIERIEANAHLGPDLEG